MRVLQEIHQFGIQMISGVGQLLLVHRLASGPASILTVFNNGREQTTLWLNVGCAGEGRKNATRACVSKGATKET
jgi:hypothetical protein